MALYKYVYLFIYLLRDKPAVAHLLWHFQSKCITRTICCRICTCTQRAVRVVDGNDCLQWRQADDESVSMIAFSRLSVQHVRILTVSPQHTLRQQRQRQRLRTLSTINMRTPSILYDIGRYNNTRFILQLLFIYLI